MVCCDLRNILQGEQCLPRGSYPHARKHLIRELSYHRIPTNLIPVPSRLYFPPPSETKPLSGKRFVVKDIYDIRGLRTGAGSKAFQAFNDVAVRTAPVVAELVEKGAVIVGKTKTVQFASGMGARDWVDYQSPFNPRGDGYLDPDCSSSGSASAMAAYEWLDFAIGSDSKSPWPNSGFELR
jgi:hypothetical protein